MHAMFNSNGSMTTIGRYLPERETTCLQGVCRHFYHRAIPRAQFKLFKRKFCLFVQPVSKKYRHCIFEWDGNDSARGLTIRRKTSFDFWNMWTVQVKSDLYAFKEHANPCEWWLLSLEGGESFTASKKSAPRQPRAAPALANYLDQVIFLVGGSCVKSGNELSSVEVYWVEADRW